MVASTACGVAPLPMYRSVTGVKSRVHQLARIGSFACQSTVSPVDRTIARIENSGVIACLRADSAEVAMEAARAALIAGITVLEIVMFTPGVLEILPQLVRDHPAAALGVGTVLNFTDAQKAIAVGAKFIMSPAFIEDIFAGTQDSNVLYIPGVMTPTEVLLAYNMGAKIVKVYPASALGGVRYISALKKPFQHIPMVASQGISIDSVMEYISKGASAVVLSDAIFSKDAISGRDFHVVSRLAGLAAQQGIDAVEREDTCSADNLMAYYTPTRGHSTSPFSMKELPADCLARVFSSGHFTIWTPSLALNITQVALNPTAPGQWEIRSMSFWRKPKKWQKLLLSRVSPFISVFWELLQKLIHFASTRRPFPFRMMSVV